MTLIITAQRIHQQNCTWNGGFSDLFYRDQYYYVCFLNTPTLFLAADKFLFHARYIPCCFVFILLYNFLRTLDTVVFLNDP